MLKAVGYHVQLAVRAAGKTAGIDLSPQALKAAIDLKAEQVRTAKIQRLSAQLQSLDLKLHREQHEMRGNRRARWERREIRANLKAKIVDLYQQIRALGGNVDKLMSRNVQLPPQPAPALPTSPVQTPTP